MLTIQKFAQFCHCTTQTLRYYDRIDLLKPRKFVESNHYRLYDPEQAVDFFLIKELQRVGFSIREIKVILLENAPIPEKIKERVQDYKAKLAEIEQDLETFEERKMSVENEILAYEQKSQVKIKIFYEGEKLILKMGEQTYSIQLVQNDSRFPELLRGVLERPLIGLDQDDFRKLTERVWQIVAAAECWENTAAFTDQLQSGRLCPDQQVFHFFSMPNDVSIFDIHDCLTIMAEKGYDAEENYFYIGLSADGLRHYACLVSQ